MWVLQLHTKYFLKISTYFLVLRTTKPYVIIFKIDITLPILTKDISHLQTPVLLLSIYVVFEIQFIRYHGIISTEKNCLKLKPLRQRLTVHRVYKVNAYRGGLIYKCKVFPHAPPHAYICGH